MTPSFLLASLAGCAPDLPTTDTGAPSAVGAVELWQHGERLAWTTDAEDVTLDDQVIAVAPQPFELRVRGCEARIYATWDLEMLDLVQPIEDLPPTREWDPVVPALHGYRVGAAGSDMDYLYVHGADRAFAPVSLVSEVYGARPDPERPGWCRQPIRHWWSDRDLVGLESAPVSLMLWVDADGDGLDDPDERFRWTLEP